MREIRESDRCNGGKIAAMKKYYAVIMSLFSVIILFGCSSAGSSVSTAGSDVVDQVVNAVQAENEHVLGVKNGHPNTYPDKTYGKAFEEFFGSPTWKYFVGTKEGPDEDGNGKPDYTEENVDIVEFTGRCSYQNVEVKALIQFTLSKDDDTFEATYLSFNDVPQNMLMLYGLLDKVFSEEGSSASASASASASNNSTTSNQSPDSSYEAFLDEEVPITGTWHDEWFNGYYMDVSRSGSAFEFDVTYTHSGFHAEWQFSGELDVASGKIYYSDCKSISSDGSLNKNGQSGSITIGTGSESLSWYLSDQDLSVVFVKENNNESSSGGYAATGSPLDDFTVYGYSYREAIDQGWKDTFESIVSQMDSEGISPMSRFMWFIDDCDKTYFTREDLEGFDKDMAMLARNAPYAHEGRMFTNETIQNFFLNWKWYVGYVAPDAFQETTLNDYEKANKELVMNYEKEMGYK